MSTVTGQLIAWLQEHADPAGLLNPDAAVALNCLVFTLPSIDMSSHGWVRIGEAHITVDVPSPDRLIEAKVAALKKERVSVMGEAQAQCTRIDRNINQLLALTLDPATGAIVPPSQQERDDDDIFF